MHGGSDLVEYALSAARGLPSWPLAPALMPLAIFLLRTLNMTLDTLRTLAVVRGRWASSWVLGFVASLTFVISTLGVFEGLGDPWRLLAYAGGYATGSLVGMAIESRLAPGHALLRVRSLESGPTLADALRREGYGATELAAREPGGTGAVVLSYIPRRHVDRVRGHLLRVDPACHVTAEDVVQLRGGWRA